MRADALFDTICAPATSVGSGAVSIIRISGPRSFVIVDSLVTFVKGDAASSVGYRLKRGQFTDIDDVLVGIFRAPHSYTGEDSAEIYCHASPYIVSSILSSLCETGCRAAEAGEFTRRAFLNGKMDLAQAEAVADVIAAGTQAQHRVAMNQLRGGYSEELRGIRSRLLELSALMELELDFSEEDVEFADRERLRGLLADAVRRCRSLADSFRKGNAVKNGVQVAIAGAPNSGKSTLLNALLHDDRAIVSDIPGTTRDTVEDTRVIGGVMFRFIDTAGLRDAGDTIEKLGIERSYNKIRRADIVIAVLDAAAADRADTEKAGSVSAGVCTDRDGVKTSACFAGGDNPAGLCNLKRGTCSGNSDDDSTAAAPMEDETSGNSDHVYQSDNGRLADELETIVSEMDLGRQKLIVLLNKSDLLNGNPALNKKVNSINNFVLSTIYKQDTSNCGKSEHSPAVNGTSGYSCGATGSKSQGAKAEVIFPMSPGRADGADMVCSTDTGRADGHSSTFAPDAKEMPPMCDQGQAYKDDNRTDSDAEGLRSVEGILPGCLSAEDGQVADGIHVICISAKRGEGIGILEKTLVTVSGFDHCPDILVTNERHAQALRDSADALNQVYLGLNSGIPTDLLAEDLREAVNHLGTITGEISTDEVLGTIFARFCVGK